MLAWLETHEHITITRGGKHNYSVKHTFAERPFLVPFKHGVVNKHIVKDLMKHLVAWEVCSKEEFDERIN